MREKRSGRKGPPVIRTALLMVGLLASLTLVVWRQSRALEVLGAMDTVRQERVVEEARRSSLSRRVEQLESRARVSVAARDRLGMRVPTGSELVILPLAEPSTPTALAATRSRSAERGEG
ncbi:MAG TPA: hypothetical protein VMM83_01230 [Longimicrobiales bacterium]|nr:hypothetical protein [Longimicrobiales bacterium]